MAPAEDSQPKDEHTLARNYGLDISMPMANLAISSAAQKGYHKRCNILYREFQKNMNVYIKHERDLRTELRKLQKEKMTNRQYSLYRSEGADVFSKADQNRRMIMKQNLTTTSPLMEFFDFNPWGLDAIEDVDEDLIRPQTAPVLPEEGNNDLIDEARPKTAFISTEHAVNVQKEPELKTLASELESTTCEPHVAKVEHLLRSQSGLNSRPAAIDMNRPETVLDHADDMDVDGEVDVNTERTRARKMTINAEKFGKLQKGEVNVKLRDKDGEFVLKPVNVDYIPDSVESVFVAKDPSKEKMALVHRSINWKSPTVASELKVNNRIAIQRSLMGKAARKTSVAQIFKDARERKTRHFRVFLKNSGETNGDENNDPTSTNQNNNSAINQLYKTQRKISTQISSKKIPTIQTTKESPRLSRQMSNSSITRGIPDHIKVSITQKHRDVEPSPVAATPSGGLLFKRRCDSSASSIRPPSQMSSLGNNDVCNTSGHHRVMFALAPGSEHVDSRGQTPLNSSSSMSMRDVQFKFSDRDMTEMIQKLMDGRSEDDNHSDRPASNMSLSATLRSIQMAKKFTNILRKRNTPTPSNLSVETDVTIRAPSRLRSSRDTKEMIDSMRRKDNEYEEAVMSMRRRVTIGSSGPKRAISAFR